LDNFDKVCHFDTFQCEARFNAPLWMVAKGGAKQNAEIVTDPGV